MIQKITYLFFLFSVLLNASISLPDTSLNAGDRILLPIIADIDSPIDSVHVELELEFDNRMIEVHGLVPNSFTISNQEIILTGNLGTINFDGYNAYDTIVFLDIEALTSPIETSEIKILSAKTNGDIELTENKNSIITVSNPIAINLKNEAGSPYPNPFGLEIFIDVSIAKASKINIAIYDSNGGLVASYDKQRNIEITILDENNQEIINPNLDLGNYKVKIKPDQYEISNGAYFIYLEMDGFSKYFPIVRGE